MKKFPLGIQLYNVRDDCKKDFKATVSALAKIGYQGVEFAGIYGGMSPEELAAFLKELRIVCCGLHVPFEHLLDPKSDSYRYAKAVQAPFITTSCAGEVAKDWQGTIAKLREAGRVARSAGLTFTYHNHAQEFQKIGGQYALDLLYEAAEPATVQAELDTYWIRKGGEDPAAYIRKYSGRAPQIHLKDMDRGRRQFHRGRRRTDGPAGDLRRRGEGRKPLDHLRAGYVQAAAARKREADDGQPAQGETAFEEPRVKISMMTYTMARGLKKGEPFDVKSLCQFTARTQARRGGLVRHLRPRPARGPEDDGRSRPENLLLHLQMRLQLSRRDGARAGPRGIPEGVETAALLGADKVMLPVSGKKERTREESFRNVMNGIREVIGLADKAGVTVTIENFPNYLSPFISSADVNRAVAELPQLRITFDNGNVATAGEGAYDGFRNSAKWVVHAHSKDFKVCGETEQGAMRCFDGKFRSAALVGDEDVDQLGGLRAMKEAGYKGCINFEYEGNDLTPHDATIVGVRRLREWIASLA